MKIAEELITVGGIFGIFAVAISVVLHLILLVFEDI